MKDEFTPIESTDYSGYFIIPGYSKILIARDSEIISKADGQVLKQSRPIPNSYRWVKVYSDEHGGFINQSVHVLVALAFKVKPENVEKPIPNHLDGDKLNNHESNIEWTSYSGNIIHAYATGLRTDNKHVLAKNIETGEIKEWYSLGECGREFGVKAERVLDWCRNRGVVYKDHWIFKYKEDPLDWPNKADLINNGDKFQKKAVVAIKDDEIVIAASVSQLCNLIECTKVQSIQRQLRLYNKASYNDWSILYKSDAKAVLSK